MADQLKALFTTSKPISGHKDKLAQTKLREREIKELHRQELQASKHATLERKEEHLRQVREERTFHNTKRAAKDERRAAKKDAHAQTGQMCEHGVWRCRICYPHHGPKPL